MRLLISYIEFVIYLELEWFADQNTCLFDNRLLSWWRTIPASWPAAN